MEYGTFNIIISFIIGMVVMDSMWAWRLGIPQNIWRKFRQKYKR